MKRLGDQLRVRGRHAAEWATRQVEVNRVSIVALATVLGLFLAAIVYVGLSSKSEADESRDKIAKGQHELRSAVARLQALEQPTPQSLRQLLERLVNGATPARRKAAARELDRVLQRLSDVRHAEREGTDPPLSADRQQGVPRRPSRPQGFIIPPGRGPSPPSSPQGGSPQAPSSPPAQQAPTPPAPPRAPLIPTPEQTPQLPLVPQLIEGLNREVCRLTPQLCR